MEQRLTKLYQIITAVCSILFVLLFIAAGIRQTNPQWKKTQENYKKMAINLTPNEQQRDAIQSSTVQIQQILLDDLNRVDRCITCHKAVTEPNFSEQPVPLKTHSGDMLHHHAVERFGCTICHGGQGQAVDQKNAHARHAAVNWPQPLLSLDHIQASCGQCHLSIFSSSSSLEGTDVFQSGHDIFSDEGCLG